MEYPNDRSAFVPLDPKWPPQRVMQVIEQSGLSVVIVTDRSGSGTAALKQETLDGLICSNCPILHFTALLSDHSCGNTSSDNRGDTSTNPSDPRETGSLLQPPLPWCYVMFTSGSTGSPLGVLGTEQGILNRCRWMARQEVLEHEGGAGINPLIHVGDRVAVKTSVGFVDSIWEAFAPLLLPASAVVLSPDLMLHPEALLEALRVHRVTHLASVPSLLQLLLPALVSSNDRLQSVATADPDTAVIKPTPAKEEPLCLRVLVSSGEPLPCGLAEGIIKGLPKGCKLLNLYGGSSLT